MKKLTLIFVTVLLTLAALLLAWQLRSVFGILLLAIVAAGTLGGFVTTLERRGWRRIAARVVVISLMLLLFVVFIVHTVYAIGERLPAALEDFRVMYSELLTSLQAGNGAQRTLALRLPQPARLDDILLGSDGSGLLYLASSISSNFGLLISNLVLIAFLALYWIADRERLERLWLSLLSPSQRLRARDLFYQMEVEIGTHVRSQIAQYALSLPLLILGYYIMDMKYPLLLAWIVSLAWFLPLVGGILAVMAAFLLGLINGYFVAGLAVIYTMIILIITRNFTDRFSSLRERSGSILGLAIAMILIDLFGFIGLFFAIPTTVALQTLIRQWLFPTEPVTTVAPDLQVQSFVDRFASIQNRIEQNESELSLRTLSIFERLQSLVEAMNLRTEPIHHRPEKAIP